MVLLTQNRARSVENICNELNMSKRSIYRYIDSFRDLGFVVVKEGTRYRLDHSSPYFAELTKKVRLTDGEAATVFRALSAVHNTTPEVRELRVKMANLYSRQELTGKKEPNRHIHNIVNIYDAIRLERMVMLQRFVDPDSGAAKDIIVEPYMLMPGEDELHAFDMSAGENRTFRLSRVRNVELLDVLWVNGSKHARIETDLFGTKGEATLPLQIALGTPAAIALLKQYPDAEDAIRLDKDGREVLKTKVCGYEAPARFVMSRIDEVEFVNSPDFESYVREKVQHLAGKMLARP